MARSSQTAYLRLYKDSDFEQFRDGDLIGHEEVYIGAYEMLV